MAVILSGKSERLPLCIEQGNHGIATLFVGAILIIDVSAVIAALFIFAMLALIVGLLSFLREIFLAAGGIHVTPR